MEPRLVCPDDFGILSEHYYFVNRERFDLSLSELASVGITDDKCRIGQHLVEPLRRAQALFNLRHYDLVIKDGYRSPQLYQLVFDKRTSREGGDHFGKANTSKLLNMDRMIHASGNVVDIDLRPQDGSSLRFRGSSDGVAAHTYGFYADRPDAESRQFQANQDYMKNVMFKLGFKYGTLVEYWHFELPKIDD